MTRTSWYQVPDVLHRKSYFSTCLLEGKLLVAGGYKKVNMMEDGEVSGEGEMYSNAVFWFMQYYYLLRYT